MVAEMAQAAQQTSSLVHDLKLSSVVPAKITGDNRVHELTGMDLAVKLHYLRGVYFFRGTDSPLGIDTLKEPIFRCLELYYPVAGRIRRAEDDGEAGGGRPFVKCNDSGVRIVEARSEKTVDEWLDMEDHAEIDDKVLVYDHVLGPDLGFTPLVFIQFTWFKCGGMSVGLSWAHVLGDAISASSFLNLWGHIMAGHELPRSLHVPSPGPGEAPGSPDTEPGRVSSLRRVNPAGDRWITATNRKMRTRSLLVTGDQLGRLMTPHAKSSTFHALSAVIWKSISKIRGEGWPRIVNICTASRRGETDRCHLGNRMTVDTVEAGSLVSEADVSELVSWMEDHTADETRGIEEMVGKDDGRSDYILYGANLTFVNLEDVNVYGLELEGQKPIYANYTIHGAGDEGVVLILPWRGNGEGKEGGGRIVTVTLPGDEALELEMNRELSPSTK